VVDKRVGQLIALRRLEGPRSERDQALHFVHYPGVGTALENLNIDAAVWHWVRAFHAALYRRPVVVGALVSIQTPFPGGERRADGIRIIPILQQHVLAVDTIKRNS
jgi:hypothetical protein